MNKISSSKVTNLTNNKYWDNIWNNSYKKIHGPERHLASQKAFTSTEKELFFDIIKQYIQVDENKTLIDIGCAPGRFMVAFNKHFNYSVSGIDFTNISNIKKYLSFYNVPNYKLYKRDFLNFKTSIKYDVVSSFGFIEHFTNYEEVFYKHIKLLKNDGTLIIEIPNFRYLQGMLHRIFDRDNYLRHNNTIMDLNILNNLCKKHNLKILYSNYYHTFDFWIDSSDKHSEIIRTFIKIIHKGMGVINSYISIPNKYLSPYIILIAKHK